MWWLWYWGKPLQLCVKFLHGMLPCGFAASFSFKAFAVVGSAFAAATIAAAPSTVDVAAAFVALVVVDADMCLETPVFEVDIASMERDSNIAAAFPNQAL